MISQIEHECRILEIHMLCIIRKDAAKVLYEDLLNAVYKAAQTTVLDPAKLLPEAWTLYRRHLLHQGPDASQAQAAVETWLVKQQADSVLGRNRNFY